MDRFIGKFITSAADEKGFLKTDKKIIAIVGKSNVGKSSLINFLAGQNKLARTSVTPGRTRLINYFDFGNFVLADLPGYGFANVSKVEKEKWGKLMQVFFDKTRIDHVLSLIDIRHLPSEGDKKMIDFLYYKILPFTIVATKADKLGKSKIKPQLTLLSADLKVAPDNIYAVSSTSFYGGDALIARIKKIVNT